MPDVTQLLNWFMSGEGRLVGAAALFVTMWAVKSLPIVKDHLNTPRRKQAANTLLAMGPAAWLMVEGAPPMEVLSVAITTALSAKGINTLRPSKSQSGAPKKKGKGKKTVAMIVFAVFLAGCGSGLLSTAAKTAHVVGDALSIIDGVADGAQKYFDRHPSMEREEAIDAAVELVREATKAENREKAVELYDDLRGLLDEYGVIDATPPEGGAETDAPKPEPLDVPSTDEFEATL